MLFCVTRLDFLKSHFTGSKYTISKSSFARKRQMSWYGRENSGGSWLPEEKKLIFGTEGEIVVAHGRLPSPARLTFQRYLISMTREKDDLSFRIPAVRFDTFA